MAAREGRASGARLLLLLSAGAVGVAALVAINSFTDNLLASVRAQARALPQVGQSALCVFVECRRY